MDTLENLQRKINSAGELKSVVRTMKAIAASNILQYEMAEKALNDYYHAIELGITAYFRQKKNIFKMEDIDHKGVPSIVVIVFGSDQGLVGQFNDVLSHYVSNTLKEFPEKKEVWAIGERVRDSLSDSGFNSAKLFTVPGSIKAVTQLVGQILVNIEEVREKGAINKFYIFYNSPKSESGYEPDAQLLLPLDKKWKSGFEKQEWPTRKLPEVAGNMKPTLLALIREFLFVSIFKACAGSLASENASRLEAMQRAEKNINELLEELNKNYFRMRQDSIDEELFDVVSGVEALNKGLKGKIVN